MATKTGTIASAIRFDSFFLPRENLLWVPRSPGELEYVGFAPTKFPEVFLRYA